MQNLRVIGELAVFNVSYSENTKCIEYIRLITISCFIFCFFKLCLYILFSFIRFFVTQHIFTNVFNIQINFETERTEVFVFII